MDDGQLARQLLDIIIPGDAMIREMIGAGEPLLAVVTLLEVAIEHHRPVPQPLLDGVQALLDENAFDAEDARGVAADLATLRAGAPTLR